MVTRSVLLKVCGVIPWWAMNQAQRVAVWALLPTYGTFYDRSMGGTLVPPALSILGFDPEATNCVHNFLRVSLSGQN